MDVLEEGAWQKIFKVKPPVFTREEKTRMAGRHEGVTIGLMHSSHLATTLSARTRAA